MKYRFWLLGMLLLLSACERGGWVTSYGIENTYVDLENRCIYQLALREKAYYYKSIGSCSGGSRHLQCTYYMVEYHIGGKQLDAKVTKLVSAKFNVGNIDTFVKLYCNKHKPAIDHARVFATPVQYYSQPYVFKDTALKNIAFDKSPKDKRFITFWNNWFVYANLQDIDWVADTLFFYKYKDALQLQHKLPVGTSAILMDMVYENDTSFIVLRDKELNTISFHCPVESNGKPGISQQLSAINTAAIPYSFKFTEIERWVSDRYRFDRRTGDLLWLNEAKFTNANAYTHISMGFDTVAFIHNGNTVFYENSSSDLARQLERLK